MAKRVTTLFIRDTSINLLVMKGEQVDKWASLPLEPGLVSQGLVVDEEQVAEKVKQIFKETGASTSKVITASAMAWDVSATSRSRPGCACRASVAWGVVTTGVPTAIDSSNLFWMPTPYRMGSTATVAWAKKGRKSGTVPVTVMRRSSAKANNWGVGSLPAMMRCAEEPCCQICGMTCVARSSAAATLA